jgi:transcriptional regulator with XRE-family HTH domain
MPRRPALAIDEQIGARLRELRQIRHVSQEELARKLNVSFQQVQKYEKGKNRITVATLVEICSIFKIPVTHFFDGLIDESGAQTEPDPFLVEIKNLLASPGAAEFLKDYMAITGSKARKSVADLVKVLAATTTC